MRIKLGSVVTEYVDAVGKNIRGRVVYIHPQKRLALLRADATTGATRSRSLKMNTLGSMQASRFHAAAL